MSIVLNDMPPSTMKMLPVVYDALSDAKNKMACDVSRVVPYLMSGTRTFNVTSLKSDMPGL
uniref:Uncharacterized protein n=1 Tax=Romanomermis culicivorax TaxID=13658 RepID=A0A915INJ6_ROMCU